MKKLTAPIVLDQKFDPPRNINDYRYLVWWQGENEEDHIRGVIYIPQKLVGEKPPEMMELSLTIHKDEK